MTELASPGQLRAAVLRWTLFLSPLILLLGFVSSAIAGNPADNLWFFQLAKPPIYPAPEVFGPVWSVLYLLMGLALALVITARGANGRGLAITLFVVQLALNLAWTPLFFGMHRIIEAFYLLLAIDLVLLASMIAFLRVRPLAAVLLVPYLGWVVFASLLTWQIMLANPGA